MIQVENLSKVFGTVQAVDRVSFQLEAGQTMALIGTSGCGKTTTLKMINRLVEPTTGRVLVNGVDLTTLPLEEMRRKMGYVIQDIGLFPHYTIEQNIGLIPKLLKWDTSRIKSRVRALMEQLKLPPAVYSGKYPKELSGGQQQRVGIARALAADPPIILMDEPFGALDPITRTSIRKEFMQLEELSSKTTLFITHDVQEAFEMADLICLLDQGRIQQLSSPKKLLYQPANDFVRRFLEDKFLELEWHLITLNDVYEQLSSGKPNDEEQAFDLTNTIMEVLIELRKNPERSGRVKDKYFSISELLSKVVQAERTL